MRRSLRNIRLAAAWLSVGFVFVAGVSKCVDLVVFRASLNTWTLIPMIVSDALTILVPIGELVLPLLWFASLWRTGIGVVLSGLMVAYAGLYLWHWALGAVPDCGCVSPLVFGEHLRVEGLWLLGRNLLLAGLIVFIPRSRIAGRSASPASAPIGARGFTLVELLVVIAILAVLVGISIPALATMRARARLTLSLSNLRLHAANITAYTADTKGYMPYLTSKVQSSVACPCTQAIDQRFRYFEQSYAWHWTMVPGAYSSCLNKSLMTPETIAEGLAGGYHSEYLVPCAFYADPAYWNTDTHVGPSQWRPTRIDEVSFPSDLTLVWASRPWIERPAGYAEVVRVAFVDGSVHETETYRREGSLGVDGLNDGAVHASLNTPPVMHPLNGIRGRIR